jgi:hypothetical protein
MLIVKVAIIIYFGLFNNAIIIEFVIALDVKSVMNDAPEIILQKEALI